MDTAKLLLLQYDFKAAIPLCQVVQDYISPDLDEKQIMRRANAGDFPFAVYRAEPNNKKSGWFVNVESLAKWLDHRRTEAEKDHMAMHG